MEETDEILDKIKKESEKPKSPQVRPLNKIYDIAYNSDTPQNRMGITGINNPSKILSDAEPLIRLGTPQQTELYKETFTDKNNESKIVEFDKPNPWTKIVIVPLEEFPYFFHIKAKIPALNDFENWKQVIPNINFDPRAGELIIPSKDEASALALANLILINFSGQMSLQNILEKNLIQISVAKAKSYEMVQNKLREQIMENLYGKQFNSVQTNFQEDLAKKKQNESFTPQNNSNPGRVDFTSESFIDTFEHFTNKTKESNSIEAWDGNDFSYF